MSQRSQYQYWRVMFLEQPPNATYFWTTFVTSFQVRVRSLWEKYYADAHGLIFVIDSADVGRFEEARMAFGEWLVVVHPFALLGMRGEQMVGLCCGRPPIDEVSCPCCRLKHRMALAVAAFLLRGAGAITFRAFLTVEKSDSSNQLLWLLCVGCGVSFRTQVPPPLRLTIRSVLDIADVLRCCVRCVRLQIPSRSKESFTGCR